MAGNAEIEIAKNLFAAWSSGDADAPAEFLTEDAVLHDVVEGRDKVGWPEIRKFFAFALTITPDLVLAPDAFWTSDESPHQEDTLVVLDRAMSLFAHSLAANDSSEGEDS